MRVYELMFIISSETTDEEKTAATEYVVNALKGVGVKEVAVEKMGEKKLAYPINKKPTGFYMLLKFNAENVEFYEAENLININEKIIRYILVKQG